jgi:hypothetical protein
VGWFTEGTGGKSKVLRKRVRDLHLDTGANLHARLALPRVGVVAVTGTELDHIPGVEVRTAPVAAGRNHPMPRVDHQPWRQGLPAGVADPDYAIRGTTGLDSLIALTAEGTGH